jgi:hypothetical protein
MENRNISAIIRILRNVTFLTKVAPFIYTFVALSCILVYVFGSEPLCTLADRLLYVSPLWVVFMFALSYTLKLCNWHRLQCALPLIPAAVACIDDYICSLSSIGVAVNYSVTILMLAVSLLNAYFIFIRHKC